MKDGQSCYMIERRDHPELRPHAWLYVGVNPVGFTEWLWTQDPNQALHFADQSSADQLCQRMPDGWDIQITEHKWMDKDVDKWAEIDALEEKANGMFVGGMLLDIDPNALDLDATPTGEE